GLVDVQRPRGLGGVAIVFDHGRESFQEIDRKLNGRSQRCVPKLSDASPASRTEMTSARRRACHKESGQNAAKIEPPLQFWRFHAGFSAELPPLACRGRFDFPPRNHSKVFF